MSEYGAVQPIDAEERRRIATLSDVREILPIQLEGGHRVIGLNVRCGRCRESTDLVLADVSRWSEAHADFRLYGLCQSCRTATRSRVRVSHRAGSPPIATWPDHKGQWQCAELKPPEGSAIQKKARRFLLWLRSVLLHRS